MQHYLNEKRQIMKIKVVHLPLPLCFICLFLTSVRCFISDETRHSFFGEMFFSYEIFHFRYGSSNYYNSHHPPHHGHHQYREHHINNRNVMSDVEGTPRGHHKQIITDRDRNTRFSGSRLVI